MPTMKDFFEEEDARIQSESAAIEAKLDARASLKRRALEWITANPGHQTHSLPRELLQGLKDLDHARAICYSPDTGWMLTPPVDETEEDETEDEP
jgi:hypothetical protein